MKKGASKAEEEDCGDTSKSCKIIVLTGKPKRTDFKQNHIR